MISLVTSCRKRKFTRRTAFSMHIKNLSKAACFVVLILIVCAHTRSDSSPRSEALGEDQSGFEAIRFLHQLLDEDLSGYVDVRESDEFLKDELDVKGKSKDRLTTFHKDDPQITVDELWKSWKVSEVHNWTTEEVVDWLIHHVELPQYSDNFRRERVNGSSLPRLATNTPEILASTLGVRDPIHKKKVSLKATDAVLFGSPRSRDPLGAYKEWILLSSVVIASCGVWFAYSQRRKYETQMRQVSVDLQNIQQLEKQLLELKETKFEKTENGSSSGDDEAASLVSSDLARLHEAEHQVTVLQEALRRAEQRVDSRQWCPPMELEMMLQKTYKIELQYFKSKQSATQKQLLVAKEQCEKLSKKQQRAFGAFLSIHGSQLDNVDDGLMMAKAALAELTADVNERGARWSRIEDLTGIPIFSASRPRYNNSAFQQPHPPVAVSVNRRSRDFDASSVHSFESPPVVMNESRRSVFSLDTMNRSVSQDILSRDFGDVHGAPPPLASDELNEAASRRLPESSLSSAETSSVVLQSNGRPSPTETVRDKSKKGMKKVFSGLHLGLLKKANH